jgi:hypothetical protein
MPILQSKNNNEVGNIEYCLHQSHGQCPLREEFTGKALQWWNKIRVIGAAMKRV